MSMHKEIDYEYYLELLVKENDYYTFISKLKGMPRDVYELIFDAVVKFEIPVGTKMYRVGKYEEYKTPREHQGGGRFDKNQFIFYSGQDIDILRDECKDAKYLFEFVVNEKIVLGTLSAPYGSEYMLIYHRLHEICRAGDNDKFDRIDPLIDEPKDIAKRFGTKLYEYTNWIGDKIINRYPDGIAYCSSYMPFEKVLNGTLYYMGGDE
ncbi:hypothetical protein SAMN02745111_02393 [Eubacterium uniforme]|uniref:Uncharacterized protein n=2 Tax=Eubacterium uniforme TaxID=39495 RepID=A0A1T4W655_9FIRM|nr:hypothetical protein SAMN02745111_02393 [Eubacterium uniforme]